MDYLNYMSFVQTNNGFSATFTLALPVVHNVVRNGAKETNQSDEDKGFMQSLSGANKNPTCPVVSFSRKRSVLNSTPRLFKWIRSGCGEHFLAKTEPD
jgi:hypothetical protein